MLGRWAPFALALAAIGVGAAGAWSSMLSVDSTAGVALSILLVAAIFWIAEPVPLFVTGFLILLLNIVWMTPVLVADGSDIASSAFMSPFFSDVILLFLGGFVLSAAFQKYGIDERIADAVLHRTGDRPAMVLGGVMVTTAVLSMWMSNTATTAMMLGLSGPLLSSVDRLDPFRKSLLLGIPFAANLGGLGTPIGTPPNAIAMQWLRQDGTPIAFGTWIVMAAPMLMALLLAAWFLLLRVHRTELRRITATETSETLDESGPGTRLVIGVTVVTILGWLTNAIHGLSTGTVALLPVLVFFGARILSSDDFRQLPWDVLFLAGGGLSLGVSVSESGLAEYGVSLVPIEAAPLVIAGGFAVVASLLSTFMSNTATANLLIPVAAGLPAELQRPVLCVVAFSCSVSMALPVTTPPNAIAFGSGSLQVKDMASLGSIMTVLGIVCALLSTVWWRMIGVF